MHIDNFKRGDILTRTKHSKTLKDMSYIGNSLEFLEVFNGFIYFLKKNHFNNDSSIIELSYDEYCNDWEFFCDKKFILKKHINIKDIETINCQNTYTNVRTLNKLLEKCVQEENYELAAIIKEYGG